jgi:hypothetical protein
MYHVGVHEESGRRGAGVVCATAMTSLALQLWVVPARAAGTESADPATSSLDRPAHPSSPSAQELADRAYDLHAAGDYAAAIAMYLKAYDASAVAAILLNVATIYDRKLHERELASEYYRRYLRSPDAEPHLMERASGRLAALKQTEEAGPGASRQPGAAPPLPTDAELAPEAASEAAPTPGAAHLPELDPGARSSASPMRAAGFGVGAVGLVSLGSSVVLALLARSKNSDANMECDGAACSSSEGVRMAHQAGNLATASTVTFFAGLGLAGGGLAMVLLAPRSSASSGSSSSRLALTVSPSFGAGGVALGLRGGF